MPFPSPGDLPNPGIEPGSPALQADSLPTELQRKPKTILIYSLIYCSLFLVFVAGLAVALAAVSRGSSLVTACRLHVAVAFLVAHRLQWLQHVGSVAAAQRALQRRLSSCDAQALLLRGMWHLPRSGIEPMSPSLSRGFFTTEPSGMP